MINDKWLRRKYVDFNRKFFHDTLPADLSVRFADLDDDTAGETTLDYESRLASEILIHKSLRKLPKYVTIILLHEMAHVKVGFSERHLHGPLWKAERRRLIEAGAFTPLL